MFITTKKSIDRQLKDKDRDTELLADIIDRDDVERWTNNRFTDKQWEWVSQEIKVDTSKDISEDEFNEIKRIIDQTTEESIFDGAFQEMEDEIIDTLINMRGDDD